MPINKFLHRLLMLYYGKIDISVGNDINKTIESTECVNYHYWYFLEKRVYVSIIRLQSVS